MTCRYGLRLFVHYAVVKCEIKLFWNNFEITSEFYFTRNHVWDWNKIIISAAEGVLKLFQKYFSDNEHDGKYSWAAIRLWNNFDIISGKFSRAEMKLFQTTSKKAEISLK